jgi:hypothetical protein
MRYNPACTCLRYGSAAWSNLLSFLVAGLNQRSPRRDSATFRNQQKQDHRHASGVSWVPPSTPRSTVTGQPPADPRASRHSSRSITSGCG